MLPGAWFPRCERKRPDSVSRRGAISAFGRKAAPLIRSNKDYPEDGDKRVPDLETALRLCGLRDGMVISSHHHLRDGDAVALEALQNGRSHGRKDLMWFPVGIVSVATSRSST